MVASSNPNLHVTDVKRGKTYRFLRLITLLLCCVSGCLQAESPRAGDRHVVVVVWDGMRPDFVNEQITPALAKLAKEGVVFRRHHSVFPTSTDVNGAAIATGVYPNRNGLLANREYRPRIDATKPFENAEPDIIKKGDEVSGGKYLASATVAETVRAAGLGTAIAGTKSVALLHDRRAEWTTVASRKSLTIFAGSPMPPALREETQRLLGPFLTEREQTSAQRNRFATRAFTEVLWRNGVPAFSLLWLSEPDLTEHETSPGRSRPLRRSVNRTATSRSFSRP